MSDLSSHLAVTAKRYQGSQQSFGNDYSRYSLETIIFAQPYNLKRLYSLVSVIRTVGGYAEKLPLHRVFSRFFFPRARAKGSDLCLYCGQKSPGKASLGA